VNLAILDAAGKTVRTLTGSADAGLNRMWWNLRFNPTDTMRLRNSPPYAPDITEGPEGWRRAPGEQTISLLAPPGTYTVKLTVDGKDYTQPLKILKDPHSNGTEGDIDIQATLVKALSGEMNNLVGAVNRIESMRAQIAELKSALGKAESTSAIRDSADQLNAKLVEVEDHLYRMKATGRGQDNVRWTPKLIEKIGYLANEVESSDYKPTNQQVAVHDELKEQGATQLQHLKLLLEKEVTDFNAMLRQRNVPNVIASEQ
jgi:hypothetical protein